MQASFDLQRFVDAQNPIFDRVVAELRAGRKTTHWMWFVFPQIEGLGFSAMAARYAIASLAEARAYLAHDLLGSRLRACTDAVNGVQGRTVLEIFGRPDDLKFRSSMSLFAHVAEPGSPFAQALDRYFRGEPDPATLARLGPASGR